MTVATRPDVDAPAEAWRGFAGRRWRERIDVRDFIQANYTPYEGGPEFLTGPTERTLAVWHTVAEQAVIGKAGSHLVGASHD